MGLIRSVWSGAIGGPLTPNICQRRMLGVNGLKDPPHVGEGILLLFQGD